MGSAAAHQIDGSSAEHCEFILADAVREPGLRGVARSCETLKLVVGRIRCPDGAAGGACAPPNDTSTCGAHHRSSLFLLT
mmetsp:Transcript_40930/g.108193  ORF Transcript_40930/g.108193 Transcript_40930/m.108193 type:complete len:80 (-) Transcript_40930:111-350(-)